MCEFGFVVFDDLLFVDFVLVGNDDGGGDFVLFFVG